MRSLSRKAASVLAAGLLGVALLPAPARAASFACDGDAHCVAADGHRTATGASCWASASGPAVATTLRLTCSGGSTTSSTSGGGNAVVVTVNGPVSRVCWTATGTFLLVDGSIHQVTTSGCALV